MMRSASSMATHADDIIRLATRISRRVGYYRKNIEKQRHDYTNNIEKQRHEANLINAVDVLFSFYARVSPHLNMLDHLTGASIEGNKNRYLYTHQISCAIDALEYLAHRLLLIQQHIRHDDYLSSKGVNTNMDALLRNKRFASLGYFCVMIRTHLLDPEDFYALQIAVCNDTIDECANVIKHVKNIEAKRSKYE